MPKNLPIIILLLVCASVGAWAQSPANFKLVFEKTYLHTDRDIYAQGDTLWYKAYLVNAQNNVLAQSSGNLRVELITPDATIIRTQLIRLNKGLGKGDFSLPDTLPAGHYRLRAYTNWMRNFGDNFILEKEITLINTGATTAVVPAKGKKAIIPPIAAPNHNDAPVSVVPDIRFYPEGGSLVEGIVSQVAVKADDGLGKGILARGIILSATGDTVTRFTCDSLGMGVFVILPQHGQAYHAVAIFGNSSVKANFQLQPALSTGLAMHVKQTDSLMQIVVSGNLLPHDTVSKATYTLIARHAGVVILNHKFPLTGQQTLVKIATNGFPEGICAVTLYDGEGKPNCERLLYVHHPNTAGLKVTAGQKAYRPKETVTVNIDAPPNSSLSMAVVDAGMLPAQADDIQSYLLLGSELRGKIEAARRYFDTTNASCTKQLDLLLMTQGWRDFVWRRLADTAISITYAAENGIAVSGTVIDEIKEKPVPGLNITLFADAATGNKLFTTTTSSAGRFNVSDLILYGQQEIKLSSANTKGEKFGVFELDTISKIAVKPLKQFNTPSEQENAIASLVKKREAELKKLNLNKATALREVKIKGATVSLRFATHDKKFVRLDDGNVIMNWGPLQTYNINNTDYWTKTLTWYLIQHVPGASPAGGDAPGIRIGSPKNPVFLVVNGSTFHINYELYYSMDIRKFKKIEIQPTPFGQKYIAYYVFLTTIENPLDDNPGYTHTQVEGYYQARTFYQPPAGAKLSLADYRTTIFWQPNIQTDAAGKATVSFPIGAVSNTRIIVQGISPQGVPLTASTVSAVNVLN